MKPFSNGPCSKCGSRELRVNFCVIPRVDKICRHERSAYEHLHRYCDTCTYEWLELPKDATPEPLPTLDTDRPNNVSAYLEVKKEADAERDIPFGQLAFESYNQDASHLTWSQCSETVKDRWQRVGERLFHEGRLYEEEHREKR